MLAKAERYKNNKPIHHGWLGRVVSEAMEDLYGGMNRIFSDGYSMGNYGPAFYRARYPTAALDASEHAGVGHSIGQCIGAYFADPERAKAASTGTDAL